MRKADVLSILFVVVLLAIAVIAGAQQPKKVPRIGFLLATSASQQAARVEAFKQGLHDLGYIEGRNITTEYRYAEGKLDRIPALAEELVDLKVHVIVTGGPQATRPAKKATATIPIVMAFDSDPVGNEFVASLARPGGNVIGLSVLAPELGGKRLELLQEIVPKLSRVIVLGSSTLPGNAQTLRETELAAAALGVKLQFVDVLSAKDIEAAFRRTVKARADALLAQGSGLLNAHRTQVADLAAKNRLPANPQPTRRFIELHASHIPGRRYTQCRFKQLLCHAITS